MINTSTSRIGLIDALRGFAILAIMLLHNIEHFDFYYFPENLPQWLKAVDKLIWDSLFFLFGGKAYGIFALLFGFTFYLQFNRWQERQINFGARFLWRLTLLLIFGIINSLFFEGDILTFYAILGIILIPVKSMNNTSVLIISAVLLLQPVELAKAVYYLNHPGYPSSPPISNLYFSKSGNYLGGNSFIELIKGNITNGRLAVTFWSWENGRFFQTPALFMLGMLLGRQKRFCINDSNIIFWKKALIYSTISFIPLFLLKDVKLISAPALEHSLRVIVASWSNLAFMMVLISTFVYLYSLNSFQDILSSLSPLGRMSLTNYIMQSVAGSLIYYGYGLGMYKYTGATASLLIGTILFTLQLLFCRWWLKNHVQGPLEYIWGLATWAGSKRNTKAYKETAIRIQEDVFK